MITKQRLAQIITDYSCLEEFAAKQPEAYEYARSQGWVADADRPRTGPRSKWSDETITFEQITQVADACESKSEFSRTPEAAEAKRRGVYEEVSEYLPRRSWTHERLKREADKYDTPGAFAKGSRAAYTAAWRYGVLDDVCSHMKKKPQRRRKRT